MIMARKAIDFANPAPSAKKPRHSISLSPSPLSPSQVETTDSKATINAIVTSLSPRPTRSNCFQGEITDGETVLPLLGFDEDLRLKLKQHMDNKDTITLRNCQVTTSRVKGKLQVVLKTHTMIEKNPEVVYNIADPSTLGSPIVALNELAKYKQYDRVTVTARVIQVKPSLQVNTGKYKQDVIIADSTGHACLTVWEDDIDPLQENYTYRFSRITINKYAGKTDLSMPQYGANTEIIDNDIEDIYIPEEHTKTEPKHLNQVTITAVNQLELLIRCAHCKKMTGTTSSDIFTCSSCATSRSVTAKLYLEDSTGSTHSLRAYGDILSDIVVAETISSSTLLNSPSFSLSHNEFGVITAVSRTTD